MLTSNLYTYLFLLIKVNISLSYRDGVAMQIGSTLSDSDNPATLSTSSMAMMRRCSQDDSRSCTVPDRAMRAQSAVPCTGKEY